MRPNLKNLLSVTLLLSTFFCFAVLVTQHQSSSSDLHAVELTDELVRLPLRDRMDLAMQQEFEKTKDPALGYVPRERLWKAVEYTKQLQSMSAYAPIAGVNWDERGPSNVPGRTRAIMLDPNDGTNESVFAASVAGGLWKCTDISSATPNWAPIDEFLGNLAITTIAYDPSNTSTMYFGTGEGNFNVDAVKGDGIWKSTDGGATWNQLASTDPSTNNNFPFVQKIVVTSTGVVLAATRGDFTNRGGIMRSIDGGTTWSVARDNGVSGVDWASDVVIAADGDVFAAFGISTQGGIYRSTDHGASWALQMTANANERRIILAPAPGTANTLYALTQQSDNTIARVLQTTNDFGSVTDRTPGAIWADQCSAPVADFTRTQAWYDLSLAVDPTDANRVWMGGVDLFLSTNGGSSWTQVTEWANCSGLEDIHADQHIAYYQPGSNSVFYAGNDGGIYRSTNANAAAGSINFSLKGNDYNTTQFYACAMHPTALSNEFLAGAQDNGTNRFTTAGINATTEVVGGDGAFCHIDQDNPTFQFAATTGQNIRRSTNGGASFSAFFSQGGGAFINPSDYESANDNLYLANGPNDYTYITNATGASSATNANVTGVTATVTAITSSPNTGQRIWLGTSDGEVHRVNNAASAPTGTDISDGSWPSGTVSCVEVETGDDNHLLVTFSNYGVNSVWESTDGGTSWTSVEGNLPDMPIRWALFDPTNSSRAMVATELGVWTTDNLNGGATVWGASNTGLANVRTDHLQYRASDNVVAAATHGRGLYTTDVFANPSADFTADKTLDYIGNTISFSDASLAATSWAWNFGDGSPVSNLEDPTHIYTTPGVYTVSLSINSGADVETKVGYIHILPNRGTPYAPGDGGNFETNVNDFGSQAINNSTIDLWERGAPTNFLTTLASASNGWKTDLDADITQGDYECAMYTPNYNFTAAGTYTLIFRKSMEINFCNAPFGVQVHYSTDKGVSWTRLGDETTGTNWYDRGATTCGSCCASASVFADNTGFIGNYNNEDTQYDVSFLAGNADVAFRFVLSVASGFSAVGYQRDGFMVDNFEITGPVNSEIGLPVEMSPLTADWSATGATLNWTTYSESNNHGFAIERSETGVDFTEIDFVEGKGDFIGESPYEYVDNTAVNDRYFYRLRQIDFDGATGYSNVVELSKYGTSVVPDVVGIYPNPFQESFTIRFDKALNMDLEIEVYDLKGQLLYNASRENYGNSEFTVDTMGAELDAGLYFVKIRTGDHVVNKKVVKH